MTSIADGLKHGVHTGSVLSLSRLNALGTRIEGIGQHSMRFGLAGVILWVGAMKYTAYEAEAISGLVSNSPLMSWVYDVFSARTFGAVLGTAELLIAVLIIAGVMNKKLGVLGAALAVGMFVTTTSFMLSTPGVTEASIGGFPALSVMPGQFLLKDVVLLAVSIWLLGSSLKSLGR